MAIVFMYTIVGLTVIAGVLVHFMLRLQKKEKDVILRAKHFPVAMDIYQAKYGALLISAILCAFLAYSVFLIWITLIVIAYGDHSACG